jgi:hypothetical protein
LLHSGRLLSYIRLQTFVRDTLALLGYASNICTNVRQSYRRFCRERLLFHLGRLLSHSQMLDNTTEALAPLRCAPDFIRLQTFVMDTLAPLGYAPDILTNVRHCYTWFCQERLLLHLGRLRSY